MMKNSIEENHSSVARSRRTRLVQRIAENQWHDWRIFVEFEVIDERTLSLLLLSLAVVEGVEVLEWKKAMMVDVKIAIVEISREKKTFSRKINH